VRGVLILMFLCLVPRDARLAVGCNGGAALQMRCCAAPIMRQNERTRSSRQTMRIACSQQWGLTFTDAEVFESDSSTEAKWSRHLLVRIPGHAFQNNEHAGRFVRQHILQHADAQQLVVKALSGGEEITRSVVDEAVYTKCAPGQVQASQRARMYHTCLRRASVQPCISSGKQVGATVPVSRLATSRPIT
jgi:hypothetical protein